MADSADSAGDDGVRDAQTESPARPRALTAGPGRVLTLFYGVLAVAATGRSSYQISTKFHQAPTAYTLSGIAAAIYVAALIAIVVQARLVAVIACSIEFVGVVAVGTWSYAVPHDFPDTTVWSGYGSGYGYLPAVLPILALIWLRNVAGRPRGTPVG
jgi:hypothetical protein